MVETHFYMALMLFIWLNAILFYLQKMMSRLRKSILAVQFGQGLKK